MKEQYKAGIKEICWIQIIQEERKDTRWALTDVNVRWIEGLNSFQWEIPIPVCVLFFCPTRACVVVCACQRLQGLRHTAELQQTWWVPRKASSFAGLFCSFCHCWWQPPRCILSELVCSFLWACSCSEGEVKEKRLLTQVVTELAAAVSRLKELWHPAGKDERLDYSQISKWAG